MRAMNNLLISEVIFVVSRESSVVSVVLIVLISSLCVALFSYSLFRRYFPSLYIPPPQGLKYLNRYVTQGLKLHFYTLG